MLLSKLTDSLLPAQRRALAKVDEETFRTAQEMALPVRSLYALVTRGFVEIKTENDVERFRKVVFTTQ